MKQGSSTSATFKKKYGPTQTFHTGIHISGSNSLRTAIVILKIADGHASLGLEAVYEKIGSIGSQFSDDRLVEIIRHQRTTSLFVDSPLTLPPCGMCQRSICPGVLRCEDLSVAYMLKLDRTKTVVGKKRNKRPINPQSQRLWDVNNRASYFKDCEASYNSTKIPLYIRSIALQKRLQAISLGFKIYETSVPHVLASLSENYGFSKEACSHHKCFESGAKNREIIMREYMERAWIDCEYEIEWERVCRSVDLFQAFICAWMHSLFIRGYVEPPPSEVFAEQGWVFTPSQTF